MRHIHIYCFTPFCLLACLSDRQWILPERTRYQREDDTCCLSEQGDKKKNSIYSSYVTSQNACLIDHPPPFSIPPSSHSSFLSFWLQDITRMERWRGSRKNFFRDQWLDYGQIPSWYPREEKRFCCVGRELPERSNQGAVAAPRMITFITERE